MASSRRVPLNLDEPDPAVVRETAVRLGAGEVVAGPSDTVYGLLAAADHPVGRERLQALKERPGPFLLLVADVAQAAARTAGVPPSRWERLRAVWPGPVTVIFPAADPQGSGGETVAVRLPDSVFLTRLITECGGPVLSTSANPPGRDPATDADQVLDYFSGRLSWILDGGPSRVREPSTLVSWVEESPRVLRAGAGDIGPLLDPRPDAP